MGRTLPLGEDSGASLSLPGHDKACVASKNAIFVHSTRTKMAFPKEALAHFCPGQEVASDSQGDETVQRCSSLVLHMKDESQ